LLASSQSSPAPTTLPQDQTPDIAKYRGTKDGQALAAWVTSQYAKSKSERQRKQSQWYVNMAMFYGQHWVERTSSLTPGGYDNKLFVPKKPGYKERKTINRTRAFVRSELSKFVGQNPTAIVVPATSDDDDTRAAYAAEQAWESISTNRKLPYHFSRAQWWTIVTGTGFIKTWWDQGCVDPKNNIVGDIRYGAVTPFHLFIPDLREHDIEDQPFVINAYIKPVGWCRTYFGKELGDAKITPTVSSANQIIEAGHLNLGSAQEPDSCIIYEAWLKPGAHPLFPNGAVVIQIDDVIVSVTPDGMPYDHQEYPFTKFEHIPTATFYGDSPLVDTNPLQKEFNQMRSDIAEAGKRMARPQLLAMQGSIITSKMTNEPGQIILYRPGSQPPTPLQLSPLPQYYVDQQDRILADWEEITGQHDASKGQAPTGVTAGTAINYLQERDDNFLTTEYQSVERGWERIAGQTLNLFVQYVDLPRKIKVIGADESFDTLILSGSDLKNGTDIRMERGSSISQSQAGKQAQVQSLFALGIIDQPTALRLLEVGGVQKVLDIMKVAERKAQRENSKMKSLTPDMITQHEQEFAVLQQQQMMMAQVRQILSPPPDPTMAPPADPNAPPEDPNALPADAGLPSAGPSLPVGAPPMPGADPGQQQGGNPQYPDDPAAIGGGATFGAPGQPQGPGPVIPVDDFDVHQVHIDVHNKFRMGQEYEMLPPEIKMQFELHVKMHEQAVMQKTLQSFFAQIPSDGTDGSDSGSLEVPGAPGQGAPGSPDAQGPGATMSGNGAVPDASPKTEGQ
jgi:hypothetical protein